MLKKLKRFIIAAALLTCAAAANAASTRYAEIRPTGSLQPDTTNYGIHLGTGTVDRFSCSTCTVNTNLNTPRITETGSDMTTGQVIYDAFGILSSNSGLTYGAAGLGVSTMTCSSCTITSATIGTGIVTTLTPTNITGTVTDASTATHSGSQTFSGTFRGKGLIYQSTQTTVSISSGTSGNAFTATRSSWTITPQLATSRIVVVMTFEYTNVNSNTSNCYYALMRNGTNVLGGTVAMGHLEGTTTTQYASMVSINYEDSPASTSPLTYEVYTKSDGGTACTLNNSARSVTLIRLEERGQ